MPRPTGYFRSFRGRSQRAWDDINKFYGVSNPSVGLPAGIINKRDGTSGAATIMDLQMIDDDKSEFVYDRDSDEAKEFRDIIDPPIDYASLTDSDLARFHMAYHTFKATKTGGALSPSEKTLFKNEMLIHLEEKLLSDLKDKSNPAINAIISRAMAVIPGRRVSRADRVHAFLVLRNYDAAVVKLATLNANGATSDKITAAEEKVTKAIDAVGNLKTPLKAGVTKYIFKRELNDLIWTLSTAPWDKDSVMKDALKTVVNTLNKRTDLTEQVRLRALHAINAYAKDCSPENAKAVADAANQLPKEKGAYRLKTTMLGIAIMGLAVALFFFAPPLLIFPLMVLAVAVIGGFGASIFVSAMDDQRQMSNYKSAVDTIEDNDDTSKVKRDQTWSERVSAALSSTGQPSASAVVASVFSAASSAAGYPVNVPIPIPTPTQSGAAATPISTSHVSSASAASASVPSAGVAGTSGLSSMPDGKNSDIKRRNMAPPASPGSTAPSGSNNQGLASLGSTPSTVNGSSKNSNAPGSPALTGVGNTSANKRKDTPGGSVNKSPS